jgi:hypothetical protein
MRKLNENYALLTVSAHFTQRKTDEEKKFYIVGAKVVYVVFIAVGVAVADAVRGLAEDGTSGLKSSFNCDCKCDSFVWC